MSVHKRENGKFQVKYRVGGRQRSRTFARKGDAVTFDAEVTRRRQLGPALVAELDRSVITLDGYVRGPWRAHAATLAAGSRAKYAWALEKHLTELADEPLIALDVPRLAGHQQLLLERGATPTTVREVFVYLSGILQIAVEHGHLPANPVRAMRKVKAEANDEVNPLSPVELERLIARFEGRDRAIVLLAGHLGLRPLEVRAVLWGDFRESTLMIGRSRTKATAQRMRIISVPKATAAALKLWRMESGRPADSATIVGDMSANAMKCWGRGSLRREAKIATGGREDITLYTLRHSHASACHYAGFTLPSAARRLGHGASLHLNTYAHVINALEGRPRYTDLDALIAAARADLEFPQGSRSAVRRG